MPLAAAAQAALAVAGCLSTPKKSSTQLLKASSGATSLHDCQALRCVSQITRCRSVMDGAHCGSGSTGFAASTRATNPLSITSTAPNYILYFMIVPSGPAPTLTKVDRIGASIYYAQRIFGIRSVRLNCEQTQLVIVNGDSWCGRIGPQSA
jgi:predicted secreted protein